jgi:hypothetical protein
VLLLPRRIFLLLEAVINPQHYLYNIKEEKFEIFKVGDEFYYSITRIHI